MGNTKSQQKIIKPQNSLIVSVQHKEYESIEDCEELRTLKQLPKTVPLRPANNYAYSSSTPNPATNLRSNAHKQSISETNNKDREIRENDLDQVSNQSKTNNLLATPSIIGTTYSNKSNNSSNRSGGSYEDRRSASDQAAAAPFNPNTMLRPPKLAADGMDTLYKHLRQHFTALAVKVDCNQVSCTYKIQEMDEKLALAQAQMIDLDYTANQVTKSIASIKSLSADIKKLEQQCHDAVERCNALWKLLPSTPRALPAFNSTCKQRRVIMEGAMVRLGTYLKGSKKRWVILYIDGLMAYYNAERTELKGVIDLINATEVIPSDISHLMITVKKSNGKLSSWHFKCPSPEHVTKWLDAIRSLHFIRARSKLKYCENIPTQFLRDNTMTVIADSIESEKSCAFHMLHLFNIDAYCYQMMIYSDGAHLKFEMKRRVQSVPFCSEQEKEKKENNEHAAQQQQYIDWNIVKHAFESALVDENESDEECKQLSLQLTHQCDDDILSIKLSEKLGILLFATANCVHCLNITDIVSAIQTQSNLRGDQFETMLSNQMDEKSIQRIKTIQDIEILHYNEHPLLFICDSIDDYVWCYSLTHKQCIKLIHTPSPNGIAVQNDTLYITSLQCGILYVALKDIDFHKVFLNAPTFCKPLEAKPLQIFENIVLKEIISMTLPPSDLQPPESPVLAPNNFINDLNASPNISSVSSNLSNKVPNVHNNESKPSSTMNLQNSMISNISKSSSPISTSSIISNHTDAVPANMLFVIDVEYQLYMIRLADLVLISFGIIENAQKLFYYCKLDQLFITRPYDNRIDRISNIYHEIVSVRSSASTLFTNTDEMKETYHDRRNNHFNQQAHSKSPRQSNQNGNSIEKQLAANSASNLHQTETIKPETLSETVRNSNTSTNALTVSKLKETNQAKPRKHKEHKKKHLSNADIKALMQHNHSEDDGTIHRQGATTSSSKTKTKQICFPKSLYLVYQKMADKEEDDEHHDNDEDELFDDHSNTEDVEMEILVEVDNMLQSYMLSELRQHSKKLLKYTQRNYSFLYLYTSPYDGQSVYRELDPNYESSVPAKNLIQHSSIGPVILVRLKAPTKEQIRKQKERDLKLKKRKQQKMKQEKQHRHKHQT